jgi:hypothetical protein
MHAKSRKHILQHAASQILDFKKKRAGYAPAHLFCNSQLRMVSGRLCARRVSENVRHVQKETVTLTAVK